jgi:hypothetical protein
MWRRALVVLSTATLFTIGLATPALADIPSGTELPAAVICTDTILVTDVKNNRKETTTTLPDGSTVVRTTGQLIQRLTNERTNQSIVVSLSGPTTETTSADEANVTLKGTGRSLFAIGPGGRRNVSTNNNLVVPGLLVTSGKVTITVHPPTVQTFQLAGTFNDICKQLGSSTPPPPR